MDKYGTTTFTYDGFGRRLSKGNINFIFDSDGRVIEQSNGLRVYYDSTGVSSIEYEGYPYLLRKDALGNVTAIVDGQAGDVVARYVYDAWGNHIVYMYDDKGEETTDPTHVGNANPFRYRGYYFDTETNLYYLKSRYYDPQVGRFISIDNIEYIDPNSINGLNLYAYCGNDPINKYDPSGRIAISTIIGIIILIVNIAATANDIYQIARTDGEGLKVSVSDGNVHIENSYKIITPWVRYGYSFYLNYIDPNTKDVIQGSTAGVQFEWELHNYAAWVGIGGDSSKHVDIGKSIFADSKEHPLRDKNGNITLTGVMSLWMRMVYIMFGNPISWVLDLIMNGGF